MSATIKNGNTNPKGCYNCQFFRLDVVFDLCTHHTSMYKVADQNPDFHTATHMRKYGCGEAAIHFSIKNEKS